MTRGLDGVVAAETVLSHTDRTDGMVWVRGHDLPTLVAQHGFEGTIALLWEGFAGDGLTRDGMIAALGDARRSAYATVPSWLPGTAGRSLFEGMRIALAAQPDAAGIEAVGKRTRRTVEHHHLIGEELLLRGAHGLPAAPRQRSGQAHHTRCQHDRDDDSPHDAP